jgi:hypothetical protein
LPFWTTLGRVVTEFKTHMVTPIGNTPLSASHVLFCNAYPVPSAMIASSRLVYLLPQEAAVLKSLAKKPKKGTARRLLCIQAEIAHCLRNGGTAPEPPSTEAPQINAESLVVILGWLFLVKAFLNAIPKEFTAVFLSDPIRSAPWITLSGNSKEKFLQKFIHERGHNIGLISDLEDTSLQTNPGFIKIVLRNFKAVMIFVLKLQLMGYTAADGSEKIVFAYPSSH